MPTIIALDVSLSMSRYVSNSNEEVTYHQLAVAGIQKFLKYLAEHSKLEQVCLLTYSNEAKVLVDFTKNYDTIREALGKTEILDKNNIEYMIRLVNSTFQTTWGNQNYCQLIVVTDAGLGMGGGSMKNILLALQTRGRTSPDLLPFQFPSNMSVMCLGNQKDAKFMAAVGQYQQLLDISKQKGGLFVLGADKGEEMIGKVAAETLFLSMADKLYKPFEVLLKCGAYTKLESNVIIWPTPLPYQAKDLFDGETTCFLSRRIEICGYVSLSDIGSPMTVSRHLILPKQAAKGDAEKPVKSEFEKLENEVRNFYSKHESEKSEEDEGQVDSNKENVCVLLHGALKIENVAALALLSENWFGFIYSYADSKKKSNLMLTVLPPGHDVVPWLGDLRYLGTTEDALPGETLSFPVKPTEKRSYSQNTVVWIRRASLMSDIQKVLRHAKKLPEKTTHFYKELNRIKRAALSLGFVELLDGIATCFEREISSLPPNTSPDCGMQLKHAATELRKVFNLDYKTVIGALPTKYNQL